MKGAIRAGVSFIVVAAVLQLVGCGSSYQARKVDIKGSALVNPEILEKGSGDQFLYRYVNRNADVKRYTKVIIDPVLVMKDGELDKHELENYQKLANNAHLYLSQELEKSYTVVDSPGPGVARVQMAIIDADPSKPVRNLLTSLSPIGIGVNVLKFSATGKQFGVGEITVELKITDALTGELLGAGLDRRVGGKAAQGVWDTWYNADEALKYWAKRLAFVLCTMRGDANCVKPG